VLSRSRLPIVAVRPLRILRRVSAATAVNHTLTGHTYKTFTLLQQLKTASLSALVRMGIRIESSGTARGHEVVNATGNDRNIEIVLEPSVLIALACESLRAAVAEFSMTAQQQLK
jgi:hypothetical protein